MRKIYFTNLNNAPTDISLNASKIFTNLVIYLLYRPTDYRPTFQSIYIISNIFLQNIFNFSKRVGRVGRVGTFPLFPLVFTIFSYYSYKSRANIYRPFYRPFENIYRPFFRFILLSYIIMDENQEDTLKILLLVLLLLIYCHIV
jgi:hypothetical protein